MPQNWRSGFKSLLSHSDTLPNIDSPDVIGLHPNAGINTRKEEGQRMLDTILAIQPKESSGSGGGISREDSVKEQAQQMLEKLPEKLADYKVNELFQAKHPIHSGWVHEPNFPMTIL